MSSAQPELSMQALSSSQVEKLTRLEEHIEQGMTTFKRVGLALLTIRDERLYREKHSTFEAYCQERWGFHRQHAHRLIEAARVATAIDERHPVGDKTAPSPTSERQVRALTKLEPDIGKQAWDRAVELADGKAPSYSHVEKAVAEVVEQHFDMAEAGRKARRSTGVREVMHSNETAEWYSPAEPVALAHELMGGIDLDPASSAEANELVRAAQIYTAEDDGLSKPWPGRVWLNWPGGRNENHESNAELWSAKLVSEFTGGVTREATCLVFNVQTAAVWWQRLWDYPICFVRGRMSFRRPRAAGEGDDRPVHSNAIVYLGPQVERFSLLYGELGRIVLPAGRASISLKPGGA
jgi:hypothetical protein